MAVGGQYTVQLRAMIDTKGVLAQIAQIQKQAGQIMIGGGVGKGAGGIAAVGKEATRTAAGVRRLNSAIDTTGKSVKRVEGRKLANTYTNVGRGAEQAAKQTKQATSGMRMFGQTTLDVTKKVVQFGAVTAVIRGVTAGMGDMVRQTFELDSALVEFKKVSDLGEEGLKKYTKQAYEAGKATAKTGVEMIDAATQFKKMGYDEQTSLQLAKHATMFQNIADAEISAGDAAKFINSQMKAYQGEFKSLGSEGEKAAKVIDTVNEVANKNAVGTNDLQLALTKTSAAMGGFGNSFDEVVGIMTAGTEIMVGMPSQVARGWRTIGANILQIAQSSDQYVAASGKVKIATRDQNGEMKNTYAIMKDLYEGVDGVSASWKDLSKEEQSAIALQLAGKNNMEKFRAVMDNFATAIKATGEAQQSAGSAAKENAKYLDSLEGRLQAVKSAWSRFSNAMINSDSVKATLSGLAKVLEFLASDFGQVMIKAGGAIGMFVGAVRLLNTIRGAKAFGSLITGAGKFTRALGISTKGLSKFKMALGGISSASLLALVAIAGAIAYGMYSAYKSTHKYRNEVKDLSKANKENIEKIDANAKSAEFLTQRIEELSKVEDKSNAEKERMAAYVERLNELMPGLNLEYNKEEDALNKTTDAIREYIKAKKEEAKIKAYQENFEKSLNEQIKLEEKRKDALKEYQRAKEAFDQQASMGTVDQLTDSNFQKAKATLKDVTQAYIEASKEVAKQNNNMLVASGDWDTMANKAKTAGWEITQSLQEGLDSGTYLIPETMQGLESLISFDGIADKIDVTGVGKSLVDALQQGMRDGNIDINNALRIAQQMQDFQSILSKSGRESIEELSDQFSRGEIDFTTLQNGIKSAFSDIKGFDISSLYDSLSEAGHGVDEIIGKINELRNLNPEAKITMDGFTLAKEEVDTVLDYLQKVDGADPEATINVGGVEHSVSEVKTLEDLLVLINQSKAETTVDVKTKGEKKLKETQETIENTPESKDVTVTATGEVDESVDKVTNLAYTPPLIQRTFMVTGEDDGAMSLYEEIQGAKIKPKTMTVKGKVDGSFNTAKSKYSGVGDKSVTVSIGGRIKQSLTNAINKAKAALKLGGNATGTRFAAEGLSEVNERGWEFIRDRKTGQLRIAGGGQRTVTYLDKGDIVYTHQESKQMVAQNKDIKIPQHASGKNNTKKEAQDAYNNSWEKRKTNYENAIAKLEYQAKAKGWTDEALAKYVRTTYNNHIKALKSWNAKNKTVQGWKRKGAKVKSDFGVEIAREVHLREVDSAHEKRIEQIEKSIESLGRDAKTDHQTASATDSMIANITAHRKAGRISLEEYNKYRKEIYQGYIDSMMKLHKEGRRSYSDMKADLDKYVKEGKITWAEYYNYLQDLMEEQLDQQTKLLNKQLKKEEDTYSLATSWIDRKIAQLEKENEETDEQNELIEKQNDLEKARSQKIKVYRQGRGFVYEQDTQAIKEATSALREFKKEEDSPELKRWKAIRELFDDLEASASIKNLEVLIGNSFEDLFGGFETDIAQWTTFIKENLAQRYGIENLLDILGELENINDIGKYLDPNGNIKSDIISDSIANNRFASGTLSAPAGFARVAEQGYEIALLGKGDAVMPHEVSENLMSWGKHSPIEYATALSNSATSQVFNFDRLVLPNVTNADSFMRELNNLPNNALQYSRKRA